MSADYVVFLPACNVATISAVLRTRPMRGKMLTMALVWLSAVRDVMASSAKTCSKPRS